MAATNFYQPNPNLWMQNQYQASIVPPVPVSQNQGPMIWVTEKQAETYPVAPNVTVILWDSEKDTIYIKSTDILGKPSIKILDYTIRENKVSNDENKPEYATKQDLVDLMNKFSEEIKQLRPLPNRKLKEEN